LQTDENLVLLGFIIRYQSAAGDVLHTGQPDVGIPFQLGNH
jgi:hypothetical protein